MLGYRQGSCEINMNVLFITLLDIRSIDEHNIYTDLLREFIRHDHNVFIVSPVERHYKKPTEVLVDWNVPQVKILKIKTGNIQKTNVVEKGISTVLLEFQITAGIKKFFPNIKFDLVLYTTPPITLVKPIAYIKKRDAAKTFLLLKDIFPQNAVDLGMLSAVGIKGILYRFFRHKEKLLYAISDRIGCMSQANVDYVLRHNPEITPEKVLICPNCIEVQDVAVSEEERVLIRQSYGIPQDKMVFVYGGNLGKPQGIPFILDCLKTEKNNNDVYFLIIGNGTEFEKIAKFFKEERPMNAKLMQSLPKDEFDRLLTACDVGLIFLDYRFTIPNFPSRLLSYMQAKLPVLACTDVTSDVGKVIVEGGFGWWCESNSVEKFSGMLKSVKKYDCKAFGNKSYQYLCDFYNVCVNFEQIKI